MQQLTVHLFDQTVAGLADVLDCEGKDRQLIFERTPKVDLDFECVVAGIFRSRDKPIWADYLDPYFDIPWRPSVAASIALFSHVARRWFAVTFGHGGRHLLRTDRLVYNFGIRVTANTIGDRLVRDMSWVALDGRSRRTMERIAIPGSVRDFTVDVDTEWVRSLGGWTDDELTRGMGGSQALTVAVNPDHSELKQLHELLAHLLDRYEATEYQARFPFLDLIQPLRPTDPQIAELDARLVELLRTGGKSDFGVLAPDPQPGDTEEYRYRIFGPRRGQRHGMDWLGVKTAAANHPDPLSIRVETLDTTGRRLSTRRRLREFISAELPGQGSERFVLVCGAWYEVNAERYVWLENCLRRIPEWDAQRLKLPTWLTSYDENAYNKEVERRCHWLNLHTDNFFGPDRRYDRVERCDLLTSAGEMICVKKMADAKNLSHLFSQGSVSAKLYGDDPKYRQQIHDRLRDRWPDAAERQPTIVYAIATERDGPLRQTLPFFSRINLCNQSRIIRGCGLDVALVRVPMSHFPENLAIPVQRAGECRPRQEGLF
jgi:uncharacterized protein (TIGR04141 family)